MRMIGIDIGLAGAVAAVDAQGYAAVHDLICAEEAAGRVINGRELLDLLHVLAPVREAALVVAEDIRPRPQGNKGAGNTMFSQGSLMQSRGVVDATCRIAGIRVQWVHPQTWKRFYGMIGADKDDARARAKTHFPALAMSLQRVKDHNRAEALLIARYGLCVFT